MSTAHPFNTHLNSFSRVSTVLIPGLFSIFIADSVYRFNCLLAAYEIGNDSSVAQLFGIYVLLLFLPLLFVEMIHQEGKSVRAYKVLLAVQFILLLPVVNLLAWPSDEWDFFKNPAYQQIERNVLMLVCVVAIMHLAAFLALNAMAKKFKAASQPPASPE